jgi:hypothetical protein
MNLEKHRQAYDAAMKASKRKHPEAKRDQDGHCALCGYNWDEDIEAIGKHLCPPGYYYTTPA